MDRYYLECQVCKHHTQLNTKYLIFCEKCGKKFLNNFTDWNKKNPKKNFIEFQKEEAISSSLLQQKDIKKKKHSQYLLNRKKLFWIIIALIIALLIFITFFLKTYT